MPAEIAPLTAVSSCTCDVNDGKIAHFPERTLGGRKAFVIDGK